MKKLIFVITLSTLASVAIAAPELSGSPQELSSYLIDQRKIVVINANAEKKLEADQAEVAVIVKTEERSLDKALSSNEKIRESIRNTLQQTGISPDDIKSSKFSSTPSYGWFKEKPKSYEISNEMKVTIINESQLRAIAKIVDAESEVFLGTTEFKDSKKEHHELSTLEMALEKVNAKKTLYEKQLNIALQPMRVINQHVYTVSPQPAPSTLRREKMLSSTTAISMEQAPMVRPTAAGFGSITYSAHASIEYILISN